jgi:hypothetical protein
LGIKGAPFLNFISKKLSSYSYTEIIDSARRSNFSAVMILLFLCIV